MAYLLLLFLGASLLHSWWLPGYNALNIQRFWQLAILLTFLMVGLWSYRRLLHVRVTESFDNIRPYCVLGALLAFLLAAVLLSPALFISLLEASHWLALGLLTVLLGLAASQYGLRYWLILGGLVVLLLTSYSLFVLDRIWWWYDSLTLLNLTPGVANIRLFSDLAVGLMPLALLYMMSRGQPSRTAALLSVPGLAVWWYVLFLTEGRAGILSLAVAMAVAIWLFGVSARRPVLLLGLPALPALLGWWWFNPLVGADATSPFLRDITSSSGRLVMWRDAFGYSIEHFPLGIGPMGFAGDGTFRGASAHNLLLNTAAEWGLPLALLLLALILYSCRLIIRRARSMPKADKPIYACLVMAFVGVMVNAQFAGAHIAPLSSLVMALCIGLVFGYRSSDVWVTKQSSGSVPITATLCWAAAMLMMTYLLHAGLELYWLSVDSTRTCFEEQGSYQLFPRIWAQGRLECMRMIAPDHWLLWNWR